MRGIRNSNVISVNLNDTAIICLQKLDYLDGKKKSIGKKSLSDFISKRIMEYVELNHPNWRKYIEEKIYRSELDELILSRERLEKDMEFLASKIRKLHDIRNAAEKL